MGNFYWTMYYDFGMKKNKKTDEKNKGKNNDNNKINTK